MEIRKFRQLGRAIGPKLEINCTFLGFRLISFYFPGILLIQNGQAGR